MNEDNSDKPFECTEKGCQMRFSTIDHLSVHEKKHDMRLKFASMPSQSVFIADQTPTPSRILGNFLQNWEEVGLNHEIQEITNLTPILNESPSQSKTADTNTSNSKASSVDNPFAHSFKNALTSNRLKIPEPSLRLPSGISDSPLNTPSIFPNEGLMAIVNAALNTPDPDFHFDHNTDKFLETPKIIANKIESLQTKTTATVDKSSTLTATPSGTANSVKSLNKKAESSKSLQESYGTMKIVPKGQRFQAVPVIRSASTGITASSTGITLPISQISQTIPNILISQPNNKLIKTANTTAKPLRSVPIAQTSKTTAIIAPKVKDPALTITNSNNSLYKVILKLPDGRSIQLPVVQQPVTQTTIQPTIAAMTTNNKTIDSNNITIGTTISSQPKKTSSSTTMTSIQSKMDASLAALPPKAKPGRKSKFAPEEDPHQKKARSLERNRAAAMRCRLKRKNWIDSLEEKADEYEKVNEKLQNEVVTLRREVTILKTALLAHKDCPVTLQQQRVTSVPDNVVSVAMTNGNSHKLDHNIATNGLT